MLKEYKILIPAVRDSDKKHHLRSTKELWDRKLVDNFGGYTKSENGVLGEWKDNNGEICGDRSQVYYVASDNCDLVYRFAQLACDYFDQRCIYLRFPDGSVELVEPLKTGRESIVA